MTTVRERRLAGAEAAVDEIMPPPSRYDKFVAENRWIEWCNLDELTEIELIYREAAVKQELEWQDLRAAIAALSAIAGLDQGLGADERLSAIEARLALVKPNGHNRRESRP